MMEYSHIIAIVVILLVIVFFMRYTTLILSKNNGSDTRIVWYFFSLSFIITSIIIMWGINTGAIDKTGTFEGDIGQSIKSLLHFMLALDTDIKIFLTIVVIIAVPQFISYILSGLSGCATSPLFIGRSLDFLVWSIVKTLSVASGIILSASIFGWYHNWSEFNYKGASSLISMSMLLVALSFFFLLVYRESPEVINNIKKITPNYFQKKALIIHKWLTRNERK